MPRRCPEPSPAPVREAPHRASWERGLAAHPDREGPGDSETERAGRDEKLHNSAVAADVATQLNASRWADWERSMSGPD